MKRDPVVDESKLDAIRCGEVYPLTVFREKAGLGRYSMVGLREAGLPVLRIGKRAFVRGDDFHDFLGRVPPNVRISCADVPK